MFENVVVVQRFGISWTLAKSFAVLGVGLMVLAVLLFRALFKHTKGAVRRWRPRRQGGWHFTVRTVSSQAQKK
jgi:hypothetical protein